jgi:hypothetical protein
VELGFETVGNATLIVYDRTPVLVTDPWLEGDAYFGSWTLSHGIPSGQSEAAREAKFVWFSHGHPDHLNGSNLRSVLGREVLLPDHVGGRIRDDLLRAGHSVTVLPHARWSRLSERVQVWCFADVNQDAVLLVDIGGTVVVNINDATQTGWGPAVRRQVSSFKKSVLLQLSGFGDADMINFVDENGERLKPLPQVRKERGYLVGDALAKAADGLAVDYVVPFSSMHRYQRRDSAWANEFTVNIDDYGSGFNSRRAHLLPPFVRYDVVADEWTPLDPPEMPIVLREPEHFGDDWSEELAPSEVEEAAQYFQRVEHLRTGLGFIGLNVGGREHVFTLDRREPTRGVMFAVPRRSLLTAVRSEIFDDLLIGNFMRTTLFGKWPARRLSSHLGAHLTRYADNGNAYTGEEVREYLATYEARLAPIDRMRRRLEVGGARLVRNAFDIDSMPYRAARRAYWTFHRAGATARSKAN